MGSTTEFEELKLTNQLCFDLYAAQRAVTKAYRPLLDPLGLTYPQYLVLLVLWEHGSQSVTTLGQALQLDSGTLSPLLKRLESAGLIRRQRRPDDERAVEVGLTAAGAELKERAASVPTAIACKVGLRGAERRALQAELRRLLAALDSED
jgi:MarR family transcriptional regulator, organic hydroperoxide resistance regulator